MQWFPWKSLRRRKNVSRNERAEKFLRHFRLQDVEYKDLFPRLGLLLVFVAASVILFPPSKPTQEVLFKAGQIADRNVIAPFDFEVPLSPEELTLERAEAAVKVLPVYVKDASVEENLTTDLKTTLDSLSTILETDTLSRQEKLNMAESLLPYLSPTMLRAIVDKSRFRRIRKAAIESQRKLFARGIVDNSGPLRRRAYAEISVRENGVEKTMPIKGLVDQGEVEQLIKKEAFRRFKRNRTQAQAFIEIVRGHILPNLTFDTKATEARRGEAMAKVKQTVRVAKNQRIIGKHDKVTVEQEKMLEALEKSRAERETLRSPVVIMSLYSAEILRLFLFGLLFGGYIFVFHRRVYGDLMNLATILSVLLIYVVFSAVVIRFSFSQYLLPVAFVSLMVAALFDYKLGLVTTVFACFLIPLVTDLPANVGFVSLIAGSLAVTGLLKMRSRSHFYSVFILVSVAYVIGVISTELGQVEEMHELYGQILWSAGNGLFSSLAAMFLLPIFEGIFNLTTRFTLLELTDLNKPILKRLNMEAPGTYHHSMLLGSLVDAVAADVGADPLRARVMAYYHDIGKIFKPEYFAENQESGYNKHEKITAQMSSLILLSHVKDGVELAREEKLPDLIIDAIQQHHGTTVMAFFYQKALETDSHSSVNKDDFRYPGPRPKSKEAAALMLADTVEPACRSLSDPTPSHVRNMVTKLINARAEEGELDESGLTLNDLARIREKFISILTGIYHKRVAYPGQEEEEKGREAVVKPVASK